MKAERPAMGISRSESWNDTDVYLVECSCTDPDHAVTTWIEIRPEEDIPEIEVNFYVKTNFRRWDKIGERLKLIWGIIRGDGVEQYHSLLLKEQAALNFAAAIEASLEDLKVRKAEENKNKA